MRNKPPSYLEQHRRTDVELSFAGEQGTGMNGCFMITMQRTFKATLKIISGSDDKWEHVSVSVYQQERCPTWDEMCFVKDLFWYPEETVIQFHPPKSEYVNCHPYTLHLWKPLLYKPITPPMEYI